MNGYAIKLGNGCGIKATLLLPSGTTAADLHKARYINAVLVLPSSATQVVGVQYDEVLNVLYVRLTYAEHLTTEGQYKILFNVMLEGGTMYSTVLNEFAYVSSSASEGYEELTIEMSMVVLQFPDNVANTGASPKISENGTWLVYNDTLKAYEDTGIDCGSTAAADAVAAAARATEAAANAATSKTAAEAAAADANSAITRANTAVTNANTAINTANTAKEDCDTAAAAAQAVVDNEGDRLETIAHAICALSKAQQSLENLIASIMGGSQIVESLKVKLLEVWGDNNLILTGSGAPTTIPDRAGQVYYDLTNKVVYHSFGNSAVSNWR